MKVSIDKNHCQGHTMCNMVAPELFKLDDEDGHAYVETSEVPADLEAAAVAGMNACPERAITVEDRS
jgi:Ferredoxin